MSNRTYPCACARLLSPRRAMRRTLRPPAQPLTRWQSQPPLQRSRLVSTNSANHMNQNGSSVLKKVPSIPSSAVVQGWRNNVQEWSSTMSVSKIVAALNIDLPKIWQNHKKLPENTTKMLQSPSAAAEDLETKPIMKQSQTHADATDVHRTRERLKLKARLEANVSREQFNLEDAVVAMSASDGNSSPTKQLVSPVSASVTGDENSSAASTKATDKTPPKPKPKMTSATVKATSTSATSAVASTVKTILQTKIVGKTPLNSKATEKTPAKAKKPEKEIIVKRQLVAKASIDRRTRGLVLAFRAANSGMSKSVRLEELCRHLVQYPEGTNVAVKEKVIPQLLRNVHSSTAATELQEQARELLALVGYSHPVSGRGIRILTLDGGGTRGLLSIEMLKKIEEACGKPIQDLFDYICGVSTGSLIGVMVGVFRAPLEECTSLYREFSTEMFNRSRLMGAGKLLTSQAYYDAALWEEILKENIGLKDLLETVRDPKCPKIAAFSSLRGVAKTEIFMFRNYNLAPGVQSHYNGSCGFKVWEAIRASSAAPGYYEEKKLDGLDHVDGGVLTNNPTAIAIHESKLLWPNTPLQCVVSVGTGRYESTTPLSTGSAYDSLKHKFFQIVQSATDTEAVHTVLQDLLPPSTYFRFNPYMSEDFFLDEVNPEKWDQMVHDTHMYCRKNDLKLKKAAQVLLQPKRTHQKVQDYLKLKKDMIK